MANWIWMDPVKEPDIQTCKESSMGKGSPYGVCEFEKTYCFSKELKEVTIRVSGDTVYRLYINGKYTGQGPVSPGGDFLCREPLPKFFASSYRIPCGGNTLHLFSQVRLSSVMLTEYSCCHGGFYVNGTATFTDGTEEKIGTDETWLVRRNFRYTAPHTYDETKTVGAWQKAVVTPCVWNLVDSPIPNLYEKDILPQWKNAVTVESGETKEVTFLFDKIYSAYLCLQVDGECRIKTDIFELEGQSGYTVETKFGGAGNYRSISMYSTGGYRLHIRNEAEKQLTVKVHARLCHYPVTQEGYLHTNDKELDKVYDVCKWTLQICRQTLHLDSPSHQELLACTGDYYIETLMTAMVFGDMRLSLLDCKRTADWLCMNHGRMFHTTYSLIWVMMVYDTYLFTGDGELLSYCEKALDALLARFDTYMGENGLIDNPPDYMFIDWLVTEDFSMHHPPKALGQTALNCFYHGALQTAEKIYRILHQTKKADTVKEKALSLKSAVNRLLFDDEKKLYFDGLPTEQEESKPWRPKNVAIRHFSRHANTLAVLYHLCEGDFAKDILERTLLSDMQEVQPYFMHFVLDAVWETGLFATYGMALLDKWKPSVKACDKGLQEGWYAPEKGYSFDHSHAWGGTPAYQLPARLLGFSMVEPGFRKISLCPRLYGLEFYEIAVPTPMGYIQVSLKKGEKPHMIIPEGITLV